MTRRRKYRPKPVRGNMLVAGYSVLRPIDAILTRLEIDGTIDVAGNVAVFDDGDEIYEIVPALAGLIDWLELLPGQVDLSAYRLLKNQLHYHMPISESVVVQCRDGLPALRRLISLTPPDIAASKLLAIQISSYL